MSLTVRFTELSWPKLADQCTCMNAADCDHAIYVSFISYRHHKSGEKSRHFSYPDYFTYPVCQRSACGQRSPDNRGCTVYVTCM